MVMSSVDEVLALFERWGDHRYDEEVGQIDHALQCAALASLEGSAPTLVAAALLHDLGHLMELEEQAGTIGDLAVDRHHDALAARALAPLFPPAVTAPIALHVEAKRYLCAVDPTHLSKLSAGSIRSLRAQGGPMGPDEVARFEAHPRAADAVALRRWDDLGKVVGLEVAPLASYEGLLRSLATGG